jgi:hypothetical protein
VKKNKQQAARRKSKTEKAFSTLSFHLWAFAFQLSALYFIS